jgi:hypothetical protein
MENLNNVIKIFLFYKYFNIFLGMCDKDFYLFLLVQVVISNNLAVYIEFKNNKPIITSI